MGNPACGAKANFGLAERGVEQRREDMMFVRRAMAGAEVARIVGVDAVSDGAELAVAR